MEVEYKVIIKTIIGKRNTKNKTILIYLSQTKPNGTNSKALEINLKVQKYLPVAHTRYILGLYMSLGGKYLTISSDAHQLKTYYENLDKYIKIIKEEGFNKLTYFVKREINLLPIWIVFYSANMFWITETKTSIDLLLYPSLLMIRSA